MGNPLSIAVVCFPSLGGSGIIAAEIAAGMAARGHRVHLVASALPSRRLPECPHLTFHEIRMRDYPLFEHPPYAIAAAATLVDISSRQPLDLIHAHYAIPHAASAYLARQVLGDRAPRVVTTLHGTDVTELGHDPSYCSITRFALEQSDRVTTPSLFLRNETYRLLGLPTTRAIDVIPNFVDTEHFHPTEPTAHRWNGTAVRSESEAGPLLFHVSNFRPIKRVADLVEALAHIRRHVPARLVLVGDGPDRPHVARRVSELGLETSVAFLGKRTDFATELACADVFLLASESESFGVAALEALSCGVPVVAYEVGGLREVVTGDCGLLVTSNTPSALATGVLELLHDDARRARASQAARARAVAHFDRSAGLDAYERLFRETSTPALPRTLAREAGCSG